MQSDIDEYRHLWEAEGTRIEGVIQQMSGLVFVDQVVNSLIGRFRSQSHPLILRANLDIDAKRATLVHELCHRIIKSNRSLESRASSLDSHKELDLLLYDIWSALYGRHWADRAVIQESEMGEPYKEAWKWALSFTETERAREFRIKVHAWNNPKST